MEDEKLLALLRKRPACGMEVLITQYGGLCYRIVFYRLAGCLKEDIEECVNDAFVSFYESIHRIDLSKGSIKAYLSVIARRRAADKYKKIRQSILLPIHDDMPDEENDLIAKERKIQLHAYLQLIGEEDRNILMWKYYYGYSTKQIACALQLKENTVDKKAQRALEKLRATVKGGEKNEA